MPISKRDIKSVVIPIWKILLWIAFYGANVDKWYDDKFETTHERKGQDMFVMISWVFAIFPASIVSNSNNPIEFFLSFFGVLFISSLVLRYCFILFLNFIEFLYNSYQKLPEEREGQRPILTQSSLKAIYDNLKSGTLYFLNDFFAGYSYFEKVGYENERLYLILLSYLLGFVVAISSQMLVDIGLGLSLIGFLIFLFFIVLFAFTIRKLGLLAIEIISSFFHLLPEGRKLKEKNDLNHNLEESTVASDLETDAVSLKEDHIG